AADLPLDFAPAPALARVRAFAAVAAGTVARSGRTTAADLAAGLEAFFSAAGLVGAVPMLVTARLFSSTAPPAVSAAQHMTAATFAVVPAATPPPTTAAPPPAAAVPPAAAPPPPAPRPSSLANSPSGEGP